MLALKKISDESAVLTCTYTARQDIAPVLIEIAKFGNGDCMKYDTNV